VKPLFRASIISPVSFLCSNSFLCCTPNLLLLLPAPFSSTHSPLWLSSLEFVDRLGEKSKSYPYWDLPKPFCAAAGSNTRTHTHHQSIFNELFDALAIGRIHSIWFDYDDLMLGIVHVKTSLSTALCRVSGPPYIFLFGGVWL